MMNVTGQVIQSQLVLHYHLIENRHMMDAFIRNKCESEILEIAKELARILELDLHIESKAFQEGGLKEFLAFLGRNTNQINTILLFLNLIMSRIPVSNNPMDDLKMQDLQLGIKQKELQIELLKKQLKLNDYKLPASAVEDSIKTITTHKMEKHKSNFYSSLYKYNKVTKVTTEVTYSSSDTPPQITTIEKDTFPKYFISSNYLPKIVDDNAKIEIVSPVLKNDNFKWRGLYKSTPIDFYMKDGTFKDSVIRQDITFRNGSKIECVLEIKQKIDETGTVYNSNYSVIVVFRMLDDDVIVETPQGQIYIRHKKDNERQLNLFSEKSPKLIDGKIE